MPAPKIDYRGMSDDELSSSLKDLEKTLFQLRFQSATDRLETPSEIKKARKNIARVKTEQRRRELDKLAALPAPELKTRIDALFTKDQEGGPGKRRTRRRLRRLQGWYADRVPDAPPVVLGPNRPPAPTRTKLRPQTAQKGAK